MRIRVVFSSFLLSISAFAGNHPLEIMVSHEIVGPAFCSPQGCGTPQITPISSVGYTHRPRSALTIYLGDPLAINGVSQTTLNLSTHKELGRAWPEGTRFFAEVLNSNGSSITKQECAFLVAYAPHQGLPDPLILSCNIRLNVGHNGRTLLDSGQYQFRIVRKNIDGLTKVIRWIPMDLKIFGAPQISPPIMVE